jgi:hypothetical protein
MKVFTKWASFANLSTKNKWNFSPVLPQDTEIILTLKIWKLHKSVNTDWASPIWKHEMWKFWMPTLSVLYFWAFSDFKFWY